MSLRTIQQIAITSALALGALGAVGCSDDEGKNNNTVDAGSDAGGGGADSGMMMTDAGGMGPKSTMCGDTLCQGQTLIGVYPVDACCTAANTCGYKGDMFPPPAVFEGCVEQNAPGADSVEQCGSFFDQVETDPGADKMDKLLYVNGDTIDLRFPGCCTPQGICGARLNQPAGLGMFSLNLGCISYTTLAASLGGGGDGGAASPDPSSLPILPFCDPTTGAAPTTGTVPGVPSFVCGCGVGNMSPGADGLPCLNGLAAEVCGADGVGTQTMTDALAQVPEFVCGATGNTSALPTKLKNLPSTTCGTLPVADGTSPLLDMVPEFFCGAESAPAGSNPAFLLANVPTAVCGKVPVADANSPLLAQVPEFLCGAESAPAGSNPALLLRNVETAVCGALQIEASAHPALAQIPEFLCGCGNGAQTWPLSEHGLPCLRNVVGSACGGTPVPNETVLAMMVPAQTPETVCGCGDNVLFAAAGGLPCFNNVALDVCGPAPAASVGGCVPGYPNNVSGCGEDTSWTETRACVPNVEMVPGCVAVPPPV